MHTGSQGGLLQLQIGWEQLGRYTAGVNGVNGVNDVITVTWTDWTAFQASLYERDDCLDKREPGSLYPPEEDVDAYVLSGHAEALRSAEVDGDVWGTLEDLELRAKTEEEAWEQIVAFYLDRACVLVKVTGTPEPEEWVFSAALAERLGLMAGA